MRSNWRVVILALAIAFSSVHAQVRVWEGTLTLPTYSLAQLDTSGK
jgi:hypothetical protein